MLHEKQEKKLSTGLFPIDYIWWPTPPFICIFINSLLMSLFPLQSVHQMELSWASKRKWSSLLRRWNNYIKRIHNSIQYPPYLVSNSDIGENLLIPVFRWVRTRQETRQRSRRLKERSTVSSELELFWQWPGGNLRLEGVGCREGFMWCYHQRLIETEEFRALSPWSGLEKWH